MYQNNIYATRGGHAVWGMGLDCLDTGIVGLNPLEAWRFILVFLC
jgi:hypothetical protein